MKDNLPMSIMGSSLTQFCLHCCFVDMINSSARLQPPNSFLYRPRKFICKAQFTDFKNIWFKRLLGPSLCWIMWTKAKSTRSRVSGKPHIFLYFQFYVTKKGFWKILPKWRFGKTLDSCRHWKTVFLHFRDHSWMTEFILIGWHGCLIWETLQNVDLASCQLHLLTWSRLSVSIM